MKVFGFGRLLLIVYSCSARWLAVFHGGASQSIALVTAYSSLGPTGLQHALVSTDAAAIFVDADSISRLAATLESAPCVGLVIYDADESTCVDIIHGLESRFDQVKFVHFDEVCAIGERNPAAPSHPSADDLCAIFYTSGSTGEPKGVPMRHKNVVAAGWLTPCSYSHGAADISLLVAGFDVAIGRHFDSDDRYLAYLPLAHVLEFAFEHACLFWGVCLGYGSPRTLFDSSVENCKGDLCELRPTYILGVPAIWETARKAIINLIGASNRDRQTIFWEAYESKKKTIGTNATFPVDRDERVFWEARNLLGGRLRFMLSGGGPIAENTQEFMSLVVAPLVNGFGLTETMAYVTYFFLLSSAPL